MVTNTPEKIKQQYEARKTSAIVDKISHSHDYYYFIKHERQQQYLNFLKKNFTDFSEISVMEIGAGDGNNLTFFESCGLLWKNIYGNELLEDRGKVLTKNLPYSTVHICDALTLPYQKKFDIVLQSAVFTSILDDDFKQQLANKMFEMLKPNGFVLWYDFIYNNPKNKDVKGVSKNEVRALFPNANKITFHKVTLLPPLGRKIGKLYTFLNTIFPFLRTHIVASIQK